MMNLFFIKKLNSFFYKMYISVTLDRVKMYSENMSVGALVLENKDLAAQILAFICKIHGGESIQELHSIILEHKKLRFPNLGPVDDFGNTILHIAIWINEPDLVKDILDTGIAPIHVKNNGGQVPILCLCTTDKERRSYDILNYMIQYGAYVNNDVGNALLHRFIIYADISCITLLIKSIQDTSILYNAKNKAIQEFSLALRYFFECITESKYEKIAERSVRNLGEIIEIFENHL